jgi:hypothetical protein
VKTPKKPTELLQKIYFVAFKFFGMNFVCFIYVNKYPMEKTIVKIVSKAYVLLFTYGIKRRI